MLKTNYHTHSVFSDGAGTLEENVLSAIDKGFHSLGFSDHAPLPFENDWTIAKTELANYLAELYRLKIKYKDKILIKSGLEIDYIENLMGPYNQYYRDLELDFIIGSVHVLKVKNKKEYLGIDYTKNEIERLISETFNGETDLLVKDYYRNIRNMSDKGGLDIIGHLDVVKKTNIKSIYFDESDSWYKREIEKTLECIADNKQILEVNTGQVFNDYTRIYPSQWILKKAKTYNIPIMLNSDAHRPDRIDNYFEKAKLIIKEAGYTNLKILKGNEWINDRIV